MASNSGTLFMAVLLRTFGVFCASLLLSVSLPATGSSFNAGEASFPVRFGDQVVTHRVMAVTVMPATPVLVAIDADVQGGPYHLDAPPHTTRSITGRLWRFHSPTQPGLYPVTVTDSSTGASVQLKEFVLTPWDHDGARLEGYRIGTYQNTPMRGLKTYERPEGFIEVTPENKDVLVAPHFRLEQFLCKQADVPQFALLRPRLLTTLERILAGLNARGHNVSTLHVMSGYRTPYYNRAIGNTTVYSRHLYGDAADIFVDTDRNTWMDDLNGDGRITKADARFLARVVQRVAPKSSGHTGGLGIYGTASHRGPFIHVDLRGYRARW